MVTMTVKPEVLDDGAIRLHVTSDDFASVAEFWKKGLPLALKSLNQSVSASTDIRLIAALERAKKHGADVEVGLTRFDGTEVA